MVKAPGKPADLPDRAIDVKGEILAADNDPIRRYRERFSTMSTFWSTTHDEALEDDKFVEGSAQWPEEIKKDREESGRPCLTYNLLPSFTRQIINRVRQERPQLRVAPVETDRGQTPDVTNVQGTKDYSMSDVYMGAIRNIEHVSRADQAYETALKHAVDHGFGFYRVMNRYVKNDPWSQELVIMRVKNSYSIYMDPDAQEADLSDAQDAFVFQMINRETFKRKYPDAEDREFNAGQVGQSYEGWYNEDAVRVAEYMYIDHKDDEVIMMSNGKVHYVSMVEDVLDDMKRKYGIRIMKGPDGKLMRQKVKRPACMWMKITGGSILEKERELPFEHIPICAVLGDEFIVDGKTKYHGAIRNAKDPQKSYNYWRTAAAETVALAPKAPWILTAQQIHGHEGLYEQANTENIPYLLYNHIEGQPPPQRNFPGANPAAELTNATQDANDMQSIIGLHEANLGKESSEQKSGRAVLARQAQGAVSTFTFPDNLARSMEHMGRLLVTAIPRIYDNQRMMRLRLPDDSEDFVEINKTEIDEETGNAVLVHDIGYGRYDVTVETGPSYATQRQEALENQLQFLKVLPPELAQSIVHLIAKNMAMPGSDEIYRILRKMLPENLKSEDERAADLPKGVVFDDDGNPIVEKTGEPYQPPLTPEQQIMQRQQQIDQAKAEAEMADSEAKKAMAEAKMREAEAKLAEAQAAAQAPPAPDHSTMLPDIENIIAEEMKKHEIQPGAHKDAVEDMITDAVVDALKRVQKYVDKRMQSVSGQPPEAAPLEESVTAVPDSSEGQPRADMKKAEEQEAVVINLPVPKKRVKFNYDDDGLIQSAEIIKISESKPNNPDNVTIAPAPTRELVDFQRENGQIAGATITPEGA